MKRRIIEIDQERCNGCGQCASSCPEGAIQMIEGKAHVVGEFLCDGLGVCVGSCPVDAISIIEKEAEDYNEFKVMENISQKGEKIIIAHLKHLKDHGQFTWYKQALEYIKEKNLQLSIDELSIKIDEKNGRTTNDMYCCSHAHSEEYALNKDELMNELKKKDKINVTEELKNGAKSEIEVDEEKFSYLSNWPIQLHLINPAAPYFKDSELLVAADCTAFSFMNFHKRFLDGKKLIIACPKLDSGKEIYVDKLNYIFSNQNIKSITVLIMQVPCCMGLVSIVQEAIQKSFTNIDLNIIIMSTNGKIIQK